MMIDAENGECPQEISNKQLLDLLVQKIDERFDSLVVNIRDENKQLRQEVCKAKLAIDGLKKENYELQDRVLLLEKKVRRNNIAVFGLNVDKGNLLPNALIQLNTVLDIEITKNDISNIYRPKNGTKVPVIIEFTSGIKRAEVFSQIKHRSQNLKQEKIFIANDMSREEREVQKFLKSECEKAKRQNRTARISGGKLFVDGKVYRHDYLQEKQSSDEDGLNTDCEEHVESEEELEGGSGRCNDGEEDERTHTPTVNKGEKRKPSTPSPRYRLRPEKRKKSYK